MILRRAKCGRTTLSFSRRFRAARLPALSLRSVLIIKCRWLSIPVKAYRARCRLPFSPHDGIPSARRSLRFLARYDDMYYIRKTMRLPHHEPRACAMIYAAAERAHTIDYSPRLYIALWYIGEIARLFSISLSLFSRFSLVSFRCLPSLRMRRLAATVLNFYRLFLRQPKPLSPYLSMTVYSFMLWCIFKPTRAHYI